MFNGSEEPLTNAPLEITTTSPRVDVTEYAIGDHNTTSVWEDDLDSGVSEHVHFPEDPDVLAGWWWTWLPSEYDRSCIEVEPNPCALPEEPTSRRYYETVEAEKHVDKKQVRLSDDQSDEREDKARELLSSVGEDDQPSGSMTSNCRPVCRHWSRDIQFNYSLVEMKSMEAFGSGEGVST